MIQITATELKSNLGKYLTMVKREDINITKNGRNIALLTVNKTVNNWVNEITGIISNMDMNADTIKMERIINKYEGSD